MASSNSIISSTVRKLDNGDSTSLIPSDNELLEHEKKPIKKTSQSSCSPTINSTTQVIPMMIADHSQMGKMINNDLATLSSSTSTINNNYPNNNSSLNPDTTTIQGKAKLQFLYFIFSACIIILQKFI